MKKKVSDDLTKRAAGLETMLSQLQKEIDATKREQADLDRRLTKIERDDAAKGYTYIPSSWHAIATHTAPATYQ